MANKLKNKKLIYILTVITIILLLIICLIYQKTDNNSQYKNLSNMGEIERAVTVLGCKFIKYEVSKDEDYELDIYITAPKDLYTNETSNENLYNSIIQKVTEAVDYQSFRIIDNVNANQIDVICSYTNKEIYRIYINGEYNYYSKQASMQVLKDYQKTKETDLNIQAQELKTLIQNGWQTNTLNLPEADAQYEKHNIYAEKGLEIREIYNKVYNIIFNLQYKTNVVDSLKPGDTLETIIKTLGTPTFGSLEDELIGYKSKDIYVFFTTDEISVYPAEAIDQSTSFQDLIKEYEQKRVEKDFVAKVTDIWKEYDYYQYDSNTINLNYSLKGVKIQYGVTKNHGIIIYNNYTGKLLNNKTLEELKNETEIPDFIYFSELDSVYEAEKERVGQLRALIYGDTEDPDAYFQLED